MNVEHFPQNPEIPPTDSLADIYQQIVAMPGRASVSYSHPGELEKQYELGRPRESDKFMAGREDLPVYSQGGTDALVVEYAERYSRQFEHGGTPDDAGVNNAMSLGLKRASQIRLKQEGYDGPELDGLEDEDETVFMWGAAKALGDAAGEKDDSLSQDKKRHIGQQKAKDITAVLEGRLHSTSEGAGQELFAAVHEMRINEIHPAQGNEGGIKIKKELQDGQFTPQIYMGLKGVNKPLMKSRHGVTIEPMSRGYKAHKEGNPYEYQPRRVTAAKYAMVDKLKRLKILPELYDKAADLAFEQGKKAADATWVGANKTIDAYLETERKSQLWTAGKVIELGSFATGLVSEVPGAVDNILAVDEDYKNLDKADKGAFKRVRHEARMYAFNVKEAGRATKRAWQKRK